MKTKTLLIGALLAWLGATAQAQLTITTNTVAPAIGAYDQYYLPGPVDEATNAMTLTGGNNTTSADNDTLTYVAADKASKGQSFTTGPNPGGYTISSVTVRHILWTNFLGNGTWMSVPNGATFGFRFGTISGANITSMLDTTATYTGANLSMTGGSGTGIYFTFDLSAAGLPTLAPNTTYFFEIASSSQYLELHNTRTNSTSYSGGTAFYGDTTAALTQSGVVNLPPYGGEFAFVAKLSAVGAPTVTAVASPASGSSGQSFTVAATVTPGVGTVTNVSVNLSSIGGAAAAGLVLSATANVYTNTFIVPSGAPIGAAVLPVTVTDTTPLTGTYGVAFSVLPSDRVWNGGSLADNKWSTTNNWLGGFAPALSGNNVYFAGTTRLTPDMDNSYGVTALAFSNTAGAFVLGSSVGGTLTVGNGGVANSSSSAQTFNVPIVMGAAQTFNAAMGGLTLNSNLTGGLDLTTMGAGAITLASPGTNVLGNLRVSGGQLNIASGTVNVTDASGAQTRVESNAVVVVSGGTLNISDGGNGWFPIGVTAGATGVVVVAGGTINVRDHWGTEVGNESGAGELDINSGTFLNNDIGGVGLLIGESGSQGGTVNLNGGALLVNKLSANQGGSFFFNGGTLQPLASSSAFWNGSGNLTAAVRNGGAVVNTAGFDVTIGQQLQHSPLSGDNAVDGGLTKTGNGTLTLGGGFYYTGPTKVLGGALNLNSGMGVPGSGGDLVVSNAALILDGTSGAVMPAANITFNSGATVTLSNNPYANVINGAGNCLLETNTVLNLNYGSVGGVAPVAAINAAGTLSLTGTNNVINITGSGFALGQFPLIAYGSGSFAALSNFKLGSLPAGVTATLVNNTANKSVDLNITLIGQSLTWYGTNALWDINATYNWNLTAAKYLEYTSGTNVFGDLVMFDDSLYNDGINPLATNVVLTTTLHPVQITFNNYSYPYALTGLGSLAGTASLTLNGSSSVTLATSNSYTGGTLVNAGTLVITNDNALGDTSSVLTLNGGTLQVAGNTPKAHLTTLAASSTVDVLPGTTAQLQLTNATAAIGGLTQIDNGLLLLSSGSATVISNLVVNLGSLKVTNGTVTARISQGNSKIDAGGSLEVATGGTLLLTNGGNAWFPCGDSSDTTNWITVSGGTLVISNNWGIEAPRQGNAKVAINSGSMVVNDFGNIGYRLGDMNTAQSGELDLNGGTLVVNRISAGFGTNVINLNGGTLKAIRAGNTLVASSSVLNVNVRNGGAIVDTAGLTNTITAALNHSTIAGDNATDGGLTKTGNGMLLLNSVNTYTGPTVVNAGALAGTGTIAGPLTNNAVLAPGSGSSGTLTITGNITLSAGSTNTFAVNGTSLAKTSVAAGGNVTYGGKLNLATNGVFVVGQQFQLFSGAGATNASNFASIVGNPGSGLAFSFTNGVLSVVSAGPSSPAPITASFSGGVLSLSWPAGQNWRLQGQTNSLTTGLSTNWVYLTDGSVSSTNITVDPTKPTMFYRLVYP